MFSKQKQFFVATATLIGSIVGVGIFGVPFAIAQIGLPLAIIFFVVLTGVQLLQHLFLTEVAIASPDQERLPGLVGEHLGIRRKALATFVILASYWAAMLAYIILGGKFLWILFGGTLGGSQLVYQIVWAIVAAIVIAFRLSTIARIDFFVTIALVIAFVVVSVRGLAWVNIGNFAVSPPGNLFLPYGVILFSLAGLPAILDMEDLLGGDKKVYRRAVIVGTLVAAALTIAFGIVVYGVTGVNTSEDAMSGLASLIGRPGLAMLSLIGFFAVATSFFPMGLNVREMFEYDYRMSRSWAWFVAMAVPVALFLFLGTNFIAVISFSGAVFGAITAVLIALMYRKVLDNAPQKKEMFRVPHWVIAFMVALLVFGAIQKIIQTFDVFWQ